VGYRIVSTFEFFFLPPNDPFLGWVCSGYLGLWCDVVWCGGCDYCVSHSCGEVSGIIEWVFGYGRDTARYGGCVVLVWWWWWWWWR